MSELLAFCSYYFTIHNFQMPVCCLKMVDNIKKIKKIPKFSFVTLFCRRLAKGKPYINHKSTLHIWFSTHRIFYLVINMTFNHSMNIISIFYLPVCYTILCPTDAEKRNHLLSCDLLSGHHSRRSKCFYACFVFIALFSNMYAAATESLIKQAR